MAGKVSKRYKEWGRRVRGSRKAGRSGPGGNSNKRKVFYETPIGGTGRARCECHYAWPCPRKSSKE